MRVLATHSPDRATTLSKAVTRVADHWGLSHGRLGAILGLSPATVSRLKRAETALDAGSKSFEAGQFLVRLFRSLDALLGSDDDAARRWLDTPNRDLGARPIEHIATMRGLIETCDYVDAYRARV